MILILLLYRCCSIEVVDSSLLGKCDACSFGVSHSQISQAILILVRDKLSYNFIVSFALAACFLSVITIFVSLMNLGNGNLWLHRASTPCGCQDLMHFISLVFIYLVLCQPRFIILFWFFLLALGLIFSVLAKRLAGKSISNITCLVSSGTLNLNSVNIGPPHIFQSWTLTLYSEWKFLLTMDCQRYRKQCAVRETDQRIVFCIASYSWKDDLAKLQNVLKDVMSVRINVTVRCH